MDKLLIFKVILRKKEDMYWPVFLKRFINWLPNLKIDGLKAISSFFPFAKLAESWISSRTAFQAAPYGVSSLTKSRILPKNQPTNSCEELQKDDIL